ncbi:conjugative transposon protein [Clostridioides difficile]|nr:conjugative transposon protein [Clostridioides difficile]
MGYLQMQLMNETTETSTISICLNIDKFYADLDFTANSDFEKWDEYPFERFHERMREILEEMENKQQELPLLFSIPLDEEMSFLNIKFCYNFIVMDKALFLHTENVVVEIPVQAGEKHFKYEQKVKLVNPKLYGRGYAIGDMGHTDYVLLADDIVAVEEK